MDNGPSIICLLGFMGCGKSTVGKELAALTGAEYTDLDEYVTAREGRSIPDIFRDGESAFRDAELSALKAYLSEEHASRARKVLSLGGGTPTIPAARELILGHTCTVYLKCDWETISSRLGGGDASRPLASNAARLYKERLPIYEMARLSVDVAGKTPRQVAEEIIAALIP